MKIINLYITLFLHFFVMMQLLILTSSCSDSAVADITEEEGSDVPITFSSDISILSNDVASRAAISGTKLTAADGGLMIVWAYEHDAGATLTSLDGQPYIGNTISTTIDGDTYYYGLTLNRDAGDTQYSVFENGQTYKWPARNKALDFYAIYVSTTTFQPGNINGYTLAAPLAGTTIPALSIRIDANSGTTRYLLERDLLIAKPILNKSIGLGNPEVVKFTFKHAMAQVRIKFTDTEYTSSVLSDVILSGNGQYQYWSGYFSMGLDDSDDVLMSLGINSRRQLYDYTTTTGAETLTANSTDYFCSLVVPQTMKSGTKITAVYTNGTETKNITFDLGGQEYKSGYIYTYTVYRASDYILFTEPEIEPWVVVDKGEINF